MNNQLKLKTVALHYHTTCGQKQVLTLFWANQVRALQVPYRVYAYTNATHDFFHDRYGG